MAYVDMDAPDPGMEPGIFLCRVTACEEKTSSGGNKMFNIKLVKVEKPDRAIYGRIMLSGAGRFYGIPKLAALLGPGIKGEIPAESLIGKEAWVALEVEEYDRRDGGKGHRLSVNEKLLRCRGFQPRDEVPDGYTLPVPSAWDVGADPWAKPGASAPLDIDDTPF